MSFLANDVQHRYYQSARDRKRELEKKLELGEVALATTPGMGSGIERLGRVGTFLKVMLIAIAAADLVGAGFAVADAFDDLGSPGPQSIVLIHVKPPAQGRAREVALVISRNGQPIRSRALGPQRQILRLALDPGDYLASAISTTFSCTTPIRVRDEPVQLFKLRCHRT